MKGGENKNYDTVRIFRLLLPPPPTDLTPLCNGLHLTHFLKPPVVEEVEVRRKSMSPCQEASYK